MGESVTGPQDKLDVIALLGLHRLRGRLEQTPWTVAHVVTEGPRPLRVARARVVLLVVPAASENIPFGGVV